MNEKTPLTKTPVWRDMKAQSPSKLRWYAVGHRGQVFGGAIFDPSPSASGIPCGWSHVPDWNPTHWLDDEGCGIGTGAAPAETAPQPEATAEPDSAELVDRIAQIAQGWASATHTDPDAHFAEFKRRLAAALTGRPAGGGVVEALRRALAILDRVHLEVLLADSMPAWGLIETRNIARAALAAHEAAQGDAGGGVAILTLDAVSKIEKAIDAIFDKINERREPGWSYRNTITNNRAFIRNKCLRVRAALAAHKADQPPAVESGPSDEHAAFSRYINECDELAKVVGAAGAFHWAWINRPLSAAQPQPADEQIRRDAERYRWLRSRPLDDDEIYIAVDSSKHVGRWALGGNNPAGCDAAIDAAIAASKENKA